MKDTFILYTEMHEQMDLLTDEQAGRLIKAVFHYKAGMELPEMDSVTAMVFAFIRQKLDRDEKKYDETCDKHRKAGAKGGRPKKPNGSEAEEEKPKKPNGSEKNQKKPNGFSKTKNNQEKHDNDHEHDHEHEHDNEHESEHDKDKNPIAPKAQRGAASQMIIDHGFSKPVQTAVLDWVRYKTEKRQGYKETGLKSLLTVVQRQIDLYGEEPVIRCIEDSMASGWQGIAWGKLEGKPKEKKDRYAEIREWFAEDTG